MKNKYIKSLLLGLAMICSLPILAQNKVVQGTVVDETGEPVIGATVRVEGTKTATITDIDGNYKVDAPADAKIIISFIGYKDTTTKGGRVQLAAAYNDLNEVVVVGYGSQKKKEVTGSVASLKSEDFNAGVKNSLSEVVESYFLLCLRCLEAGFICTLFEYRLGK